MTLTRTNTPQPIFALAGKRIDRHTFINILKLCTRAGIKPTDLSEGAATSWNIADLPSEAIEQAKRMSTERFAATNETF